MDNPTILSALDTNHIIIQRSCIRLQFYNTEGHSSIAKENKRLSPGNYSLFVFHRRVAVYLEGFVFVRLNENLNFYAIVKEKVTIGPFLLSASLLILQVKLRKIERI